MLLYKKQDVDLDGFFHKELARGFDAKGLDTLHFDNYKAFVYLKNLLLYYTTKKINFLYYSDVYDKTLDVQKKFSDTITFLEGICPGFIKVRFGESGKIYIVKAKNFYGKLAKNNQYNNDGQNVYQQLEENLEGYISCLNYIVEKPDDIVKNFLRDL